MVIERSSSPSRYESDKFKKITDISCNAKLIVGALN